jgi:hypothetical protein
MPAWTKGANCYHVVDQEMKGGEEAASTRAGGDQN